MYVDEALEYRSMINFWALEKEKLDAPEIEEDEDFDDYKDEDMEEMEEEE